ncbi:hypothetical protein GCM10009610_29750 [Pseudonocardia xinjiangensis]
MRGSVIEFLGSAQLSVTIDLSCGELHGRGHSFDAAYDVSGTARSGCSPNGPCDAVADRRPTDCSTHMIV